MTSKLQLSVIRSTAAALVLGALALGCQAEGGSSTPAAAQHPQNPTVTAATATETQPASRVPPGPGPFVSDATDRKLATAITASIQRAFVQPPGSRKLSGPPPGTWRDLAVPGGAISADGEVFASSWWKVPGQPKAVLKWLLAHEPRPWYGGSRGSFGPVGEPGDVPPAGQRPADVYQEWSDIFENFHEPAVISEAQLIVEEIQNGAGQTYTRVDSRVTWISPPRPRAERVPASAKIVTITAMPVAGTAVPQGSPATVTNPATVARIASLINGLYRTEGFCNMSPPTDRIKLTFSAERGGPPLATAVADLDGCGQVRFSVPGVSSLLLLAEANDRLVPAILAAAGLHWFS